MSALEKGFALLRLRGSGATLESLRQMSNIYADDSKIVPTAFVTPKFEGAKAITAFGGYALFKGLMTDEQVYAQRDVFGNDYSVIDFTLPASAFKEQINALDNSRIVGVATQAKEDKALGVTVNKQSVALLKVAQDISVADIASASLITLNNLDKAIEILTTLRSHRAVIVVETAKVLQTV